MRWLVVSPTRLPLLAGVLLGLFALGANAGDVYTWKDAKGITHYADSPPAGQKHSTRTISVRSSMATTPTAVPAAGKAAVNSDCSNAHANLTLLQGTGKVGVDVDKDGKADREITAAERADRLKLAQSQIATFCDAPIANAATTHQS